MNEKEVSIYADYGYWFAQELWTFEQAGALIIGLNPDVVLNPDLPAEYDKNAPDGELLYQLWRYSEEMWKWYMALQSSIQHITSAYCGSDLDDIVCYKRDEDGSMILEGVKPEDIIQWCVDNSIGFHYNLTEYLCQIGYDFRFSEHSRILSEMKIYSKQEIWNIASAARLIVGVSPESLRLRLQRINNYYRNLDGNYTLTKRDEISYVLEVAMQSYKTGGLSFFHIYGDDPEVGYYSDEECGVDVNAQGFTKWAIEKGFNPPEQLLEMMGLKEIQQTSRSSDFSYITPYISLMLEVIKALKITEEKQPVKQEIVDWLMEKDSSLSKRELDYLATFVRLPSMKKGGYFKGKP